MELEGRIVAITGGFGSLGAAVAAAAVREGAQVAVIDRAPAPPAMADARMQAYGGVDLEDEAAAGAVFARIRDAFGGLDALVNVAGSFRWETLEAGSVDTWDLLYRVNLRTAVNASRAALPHLLQSAPGARIVNVGAAGAVRAGTGMGAYAASKAGVARLTEALSEELKDRGITVNAVLPGVIDTPANRRDMPDADTSRWVQAADIAEAIVFLLSTRARAITAALLPVTGRL